MNTELGHEQVIELIPAYLAGGLAGDESAAVGGHLAACAACAQAAEHFRAADKAAAELFAGVRPAADFEDRIVQAVRQRQRMMIPLAVRKAAIGVAAAVLFGSVGLVGNAMVEKGWFPGGAMASRHGESAQQMVAVASPDTRDEIVRLTSDARQAMKNRDYVAAVKDIDQLLSLDPTNDFARGLWATVQDSAMMQNDRSFREGHDVNWVRQFSAAEEMKVPYSDIIPYPGNWPEVSQANGSKTSPEAVAEALKHRVAPNGVMDLRWLPQQQEGLQDRSVDHARILEEEKLGKMLQEILTMP